MAATLTGVPLYLARGYQVVASTTVPLCGNSVDGEAAVSSSDISFAASNLEVVIMARSVLVTTKE
jgi:hypothetical protein